MNRINFKGKDGGGFHHLTPYQKKYRKMNEQLKKEHPEPDLIFHTKILTKPLQQVKKILDTIEIVTPPNEYNHKRGFCGWHSHKTFKKGRQELSVTDSIGGCGMQQFYNWTKITNVQTGTELIKSYLKNKPFGVGLVLCQLGQDYYNGSFEKALIECGFKVSEEYSNYQHGEDGRYTQKIYSLKTKYKYD